MVWATLGRKRYQQLKNMPQTTAARAVSCSPTAQHPLQTAQEQAAHTAHTGDAEITVALHTAAMATVISAILHCKHLQNFIPTSNSLIKSYLNDLI